MHHCTQQIPGVGNHAGEFALVWRHIAFYRMKSCLDLYGQRLYFDCRSLAFVRQAAWAFVVDDEVLKFLIVGDVSEEDRSQKLLDLGTMKGKRRTCQIEGIVC
jgi:hypothetical protein